MKRPGPLVSMTLALVALCGTLLLLADLFFGVLADRDGQTRDARKHMAESLAVQVAALLQEDSTAALQRTLDGVVGRNADVRSIAIRRADHTIVMQSGDHARAWLGTGGDVSRLDEVTVPLSAGGQRWGAFEIAFRAQSGPAVVRWLTEPWLLTLLFFGTVGSLAFGLYMRRALQHLDPSSVIPERVQGAFDAMAEGVLVLDARGRVLLTNRSFRALHPDAAALRQGRALSSLPWLAAALPSDISAHPWVQAMGEHKANAGFTLEVAGEDGQAREFVINCAPIADPGGRVRGCLVTFNDVSELHRANRALRDTLQALSTANDEVERKNDELQRLATRDSLTGCLNRRAFYEALESMLAVARAGGHEVGCVMIDIDHFKAVNDSYGHAVGDRVIQGVAKKIQESTRAGDLVCRYGGEEFCVVLAGIDEQQVFAFAERMRQRVERDFARGLREVPGLRLTVSAGVESMGGAALTGPALLDRADQALYTAKRSGRNRVCRYAGSAAGSEPAGTVAAEEHR
jgi:diguanylate cyclase (GGDEF)-like protein